MLGSGTSSRLVWRGITRRGGVYAKDSRLGGRLGCRRKAHTGYVVACTCSCEANALTEAPAKAVPQKANACGNTLHAAWLYRFELICSIIVAWRPTYAVDPSPIPRPPFRAVSNGSIAYQYNGTCYLTCKFVGDHARRCAHKARASPPEAASRKCVPVTPFDINSVGGNIGSVVLQFRPVPSMLSPLSSASVKLKKGPLKSGLLKSTCARKA